LGFYDYQINKFIRSAGALSCHRRHGTRFPAFGLVVFFSFFPWIVNWADAREIVPPPAPLSRAHYERLVYSAPELLWRLTHPTAKEHGTPSNAGNSPWQLIATAPPINAGAMIQLTDGTLMVQDQGSQNSGTGNWWRFSPNENGSYVNGSWSQLASMPSGYAPLYFASEVLPDGRVVIEGGEYNQGQLVWTNQGAIYDPLENNWTSIAPPSGDQWSRIGDAPSTLLADGTFMMGASGYSGTTAQALLDPNDLTWTNTGSGKADGNGEEGWSLLPDGSVLTVDANNSSDPTNSELYSPSTGTWSSGGGTVAKLPDSDHEMGPQVLRPNGQLFAAGASGHNAVFNTAKRRWSAAPDFPKINGAKYDVADGPAAVLPDAKVLVMASPGEYNTPSHFFLFNGKTLKRTADTSNSADLSSFYGFMLVLPSGQVLFNDRVGNLWVYTNSGSASPSWLPVITKATVRLTAGDTYKLSGTQLAGLSQGAAYGDDYQSNTNFPLVRIVNAKTNHVFYARTSDNTSNSVGAGTSSTVKFTVPTNIESGESSLYVVANGIASSPAAVKVLRQEE